MFVQNNSEKVISKGFVHGDLRPFAEFLNMFLTKEFTNPKGMFRKTCKQFPFEFLIMFDLSREKYM